MLYNVDETGEQHRDIYNKIKVLFADLQVEVPDMCIVSAFRLGYEGKTRPILLKLLAERCKYVAFDKTEAFKAQGIAPSSDLTKEKRIMREKLLKVSYLLRQQGKEPNLYSTKLKIGTHISTMKEIDDIINGVEQKDEKVAAAHEKEEEVKSNASLSSNGSSSKGVTTRQNAMRAADNSSLNKNVFPFQKEGNQGNVVDKPFKPK